MKLPSQGKNRATEMQEFADGLKEISRQIGFKVSSRGWCYLLEQDGLITKAEFSLVENLINNGCRRDGTLPIDFVAEEEARKFSGVEVPDIGSPIASIKSWLTGSLHAERYYTPDWWKGEKHYIQMVVEKIDLKTLFEPICEEYHIPIATSKGWSSMLQRGEYARRFKEAEEMGLRCVLLYCGDHDPDGGRISEFLRKNLFDLMDIKWSDGTYGYNPRDLIIDPFGLKYDFIIDNELSWIDNLITASGKDLASPLHKNHYMPYVQGYLKKYGARKCEANALVVRPQQGRALCRETIENHLGTGALQRFGRKRRKVVAIVNEFRERTGLNETIQKAIDLIDEEDI